MLMSLMSFIVLQRYIQGKDKSDKSCGTFTGCACTCLTVKLTDVGSVLQVQRGLATMAGKGRGVAAFSFNIEALGIGRGSMPEARMGPSPLFPVSTQHTHKYITL